MHPILDNTILLTKAEVGEVLRVPAATIENLHRVGQLRGVMVGKHLLWKPETVRRFVEGLSEEARR